jgi:hypothetical protein
MRSENLASRYVDAGIVYIVGQFFGLWRIFPKRAFAGCVYLGKIMLNRLKPSSYNVVSLIKK